MFGEHPDPQLLERFMRNDLEASERSTIVRHLVTGCPQCLEVTRRLWALGEEPMDGPLDLGGPAEARGPLLGRIAIPPPTVPAKARRAEPDPPASNPSDPEPAEALYAELMEAPSPLRSIRIRAQPRFRSLAFCELLAARSRETSAREPALAVELGELAVAVADQLTPLDAGGRGTVEITAIAAARMHAWARLGEARRLSGDLDGAERSLSMAAFLAEEGSVDALDGAEVLCLQAALLEDQGRSEEAELLLEKALAVYQPERDRAARARALIQKASLHRSQAQPAPAIPLFQEGVRLLDERTESGLLAPALHSLTCLLIEAGRGEEAGEAARRLRPLYETAADRPNLARLRRLEGRIEGLLGRLDAAEAAFRDARRECLAEDLGIEAALALFDLGILFTRGERIEDFQRLADDVCPHFHARGIQQGESAALVVFRQQCERAWIRPALLIEVARYIAGAVKPRPVTYPPEPRRTFYSSVAAPSPDPAVPAVPASAAVVD